MEADRLRRRVFSLEDELRDRKAQFARDAPIVLAQAVEWLTSVDDEDQRAKMLVYIEQLRRDLHSTQGKSASDGEAKTPVEKGKPLISPKETENARDLPAPAGIDYNNPQLGLFQAFFANTDKHKDKLLNAVDLWDSVPRYAMTRCLTAVGRRRVMTHSLRAGAAGARDKTPCWGLVRGQPQVLRLRSG